MRRSSIVLTIWYRVLEEISMKEPACGQTLQMHCQP